MKLKLLLILITLFCVAVTGHDTWLLTNRSTANAGSVITVDLTSGMAFPRLEFAIDANRIQQASCRLAGKITNLRPRLTAKSLRFSCRLEDQGIATLSVDLKPRTLSLTRSKVKEYLDEIGASDEIQETWKSGSIKQWRESYAKHTKTFVRVGTPENDRSWAEPVGMKLEIVPEKDPTDLHPGDDFAVRILKDGSPLPNFPVGLVREGTTKGTIQKTDANGRVVFTIDKAGRWMLRGTDLRRSSQPNLEWESDFTTLTIEARIK